MDILILRLQAPLMSFGGAAVDRHGVTRAFPAQSMITGLLGNALGYDHRDTSLLSRLQERLVFATRQDRPGELLRDYHTVDLSQDHLQDDRAWTTWGRLDKRKGGTAKTGTHIRERHYLADAAYTIALTLSPTEESPSLDELEKALRFPERPLFLGRKTCLPSTPLFHTRCAAGSLLEALHLTEVAESTTADAPQSTYKVWWSSSPGEPRPELAFVSENNRKPVTDRRDWQNQVHTGQRWLATGDLRVETKETIDSK